MKKTELNLIDVQHNNTPDYYCTWQTQLYATCDGKPEAQRAIIDEKSLFDQQKPYGWAYFYPEIRKDLYLIMDDSWDVPVTGYFGRPQHGSMVLEPEKFPSYADVSNPQQALKLLNDRITALGWKGVGLWVCAQEEPAHFVGKTQEEYWTERLQWCENAGVHYWKVDWGVHCREIEFRKWLTDLAHRVAPHVIIESALVPKVIPYTDVFRTYDVPAIMSIPMTLNKLREMLGYTAQNGYSALLNCEDEVYIGAALGCSVGVMRHPYAGEFPNGKADMAFPACHRNLKTKMTEVARAVHWHRLAPAFGVDKENTYISECMLEDYWTLGDMDQELEAWWPDALELQKPVTELRVAAPSAISRNMPLPKVTGAEIPYTVCAKNPNGAVSVATLGRTHNRTYKIPKADVAIQAENAQLFGIFGAYNSLTVQSDLNLQNKIFYAADLSDGGAYNITDHVKITEDGFCIDGETLEQMGNAARKAGDTSEAGLVLKIC